MRKIFFDDDQVRDLKKSQEQAVTKIFREIMESLLEVLREMVEEKEDESKNRL